MRIIRYFKPFLPWWEVQVSHLQFLPQILFFFVPPAPFFWEYVNQSLLFFVCLLQTFLRCFKLVQNWKKKHIWEYNWQYLTFKLKQWSILTNTNGHFCSTSTQGKPYNMVILIWLQIYIYDGHSKHLISTWMCRL